MHTFGDVDSRIYLQRYNETSHQFWYCSYLRTVSGSEPVIYKYKSESSTTVLFLQSTFLQDQLSLGLMDMYIYQWKEYSR